jgi:hypothetical protein
VLVWYAPNAIYFGIIAYESQPGAIRATVADRDNLDADDRVTIYLDTFDDRRRAFFFTVNPLGSQEDGVRTEGGFAAGSLVGGTTDKNPDYIWESKGRLTDSGYVVEVRIPFKSLRYPGNGAQRWGINVVRKIQRTGYEDTWTDTRRANASFLVQSGLLDGLHDLQSGITTEFQPVVTAAANGAPTPTGYDRENLDPSFGANLRLGLTSNLSVDATYNPDFSQIESDVSLVTVNERFALFFPEKRPFFLEGIELFSTNNQLVYTRQIVDPIAGGKVTSKIGANNIALLTAVDQANSPDSWFNVGRVRRDVGANSTVGVTGTSKDASGTYNRVVAGDARIVFGKLYFVAGQAGGSWTRDSATGDSRSSPILEAEFDRTGRSWGFNYKSRVSGLTSSLRQASSPATTSCKPTHSTGSRSTAQRAHSSRRQTSSGDRSIPGSTATSCNRALSRESGGPTPTLHFVVAGPGITTVRSGSPISNPVPTTATKWTRVEVSSPTMLQPAWTTGPYRPA